MSPDTKVSSNNGSTWSKSSASDDTISIADLLDYVNIYFPDILPESVYRYFGHVERPKGVLGESALYSKDLAVSESERAEKKTSTGEVRELKMLIVPVKNIGRLKQKKTFSTILHL